jgi:hypothetical protein
MAAMLWRMAYQCSGGRSMSSTQFGSALWSRSNYTSWADRAECMGLNWSLPYPSMYWTWAPFSDKRPANGTLSKSAATSSCEE